MDNNKLYKDIVLEVDIDAKKGSKNQAKETKATFYSYDINSGIVKMNITKDNQPLPLPNGAEVLINVVKLGLPQQKLVYNADIVDATKGITHWDIPEYLTGYKGKVRAGVFINLPNGQRLHGGYFKFNMGISEIDTNLEELEEDYWQGWDEFQSEAEAEWSDWKAIRDDTWEKQEKDYDEWKKDQEEKQESFENTYAKHWDNWKTQQRNKQNEFENNFSGWKTKQEEKQESFETSVSSKHNQINDDVEGIERRVEETNNELENLDVYSKSETDKKLNDKANKNKISDMLESLTEHGFLELEKGFENYENSGEVVDEESYYLQYTRVGPLCHVFGSVTNTERLEEGSSTAIATMPKHLKVVTRDVKVSQGSQNNTFTASVLGNNNSGDPNTIVIDRLRDNGGNNTGYNAGKYLNISLTFTVEVDS